MNVLDSAVQLWRLPLLILVGFIETRLDHFKLDLAKLDLEVKKTYLSWT